MTLEQFVDLMGGLGYKGEKGERVKVKAAIPVVEVKAEEPVSLNPVPEEVSLINPVPEEPVVVAETVEGEAAAEPVAEAAPEMETFVTFTWAPKPRPRPERAERPARPARAEQTGDPRGERAPRSGGPRNDRNQDRGPRRDAALAAPAVEGEAPAAPVEAKPRREGGDRGGYKGKPREGQGDRPQGDRPQGDRKPRPKDGKYDAKSDAKPQRSFEARPPRAEKPVDPDNPFAVLAALKLNK
jgi:ATP-dependent RNA helicase SUPV3L1/SUV3